MTADVSAECKRQSVQRDLTHSVTVHEQDAVSVGALLQTHVEGMHSIGIDFVLSHDKKTLRKNSWESHVC